MKIIKNTNEHEELVHLGDVMHITNTKNFNDPVSDYVMVVTIQADTFNLISLKDGNRYFSEQTADEFPELKNLYTHNEGMKPSELIDIFTPKQYGLKKVEAVLEVY